MIAELHQTIWNHIISRGGDPSHWDIIYKNNGKMIVSNGYEDIEVETAAEFKELYEEICSS